MVRTPLLIMESLKEMRYVHQKFMQSHSFERLKMYSEGYIDVSCKPIASLQWFLYSLSYNIFVLKEEQHDLANILHAASCYYEDPFRFVSEIHDMKLISYTSLSLTLYEPPHWFEIFQQNIAWINFHQRIIQGMNDISHALEVMKEIPILFLFFDELIRDFYRILYQILFYLMPAIIAWFYDLYVFSKK